MDPGSVDGAAEQLRFSGRAPHRPACPRRRGVRPVAAVVPPGPLRARTHDRQSLADQQARQRAAPVWTVQPATSSSRRPDTASTSDTCGSSQVIARRSPTPSRPDRRSPLARQSPSSSAATGWAPRKRTPTKVSAATSTPISSTVTTTKPIGPPGPPDPSEPAAGRCRFLLEGGLGWLGGRRPVRDPLAGPVVATGRVRWGRAAAGTSLPPPRRLRCGPDLCVRPCRPGYSGRTQRWPHWATASGRMTPVPELPPHRRRRAPPPDRPAARIMPAAPGVRPGDRHAGDDGAAPRRASHRFLSLFARVDGLSVSDVEAALYEHGRWSSSWRCAGRCSLLPADLLPAALGSASARVADAERRRTAKEVEAWVSRRMARPGSRTPAPPSSSSCSRPRVSYRPARSAPGSGGAGPLRCRPAPAGVVSCRWRRG